MRLEEYVSIDNKIARSINLERDADNIEQIRQFQITPMVQRVLGRFADALEGEPVPAWSLTGPCGSGKSAFCNYLLALCSNHADSIRETAFAGLKTCDERLAKRLRRYLRKPGKNAFIRMRGVSQYEPLNNEYKTAERLKKDFWLYVVFNCAIEPELHVIQNPARMGWKPVVKIEHYHLCAQDILRAEDLA